MESRRVGAVKSRFDGLLTPPQATKGRLSALLAGGTFHVKHKNVSRDTLARQEIVPRMARYDHAMAYHPWGHALPAGPPPTDGIAGGLDRTPARSGEGRSPDAASKAARRALARQDGITCVRCLARPRTAATAHCARCLRLKRIAEGRRRLRRERLLALAEDRLLAAPSDGASLAKSTSKSDVTWMIRTRDSIDT